MSTINITRINLDTPILASYIKRMNNWGENGEFCSKAVAGKDKNTNFYGIFYNDKFLGASIIEHNELESTANVTLANGSINYFDEIEVFSRKQLSEIAKDLYGQEATVVFSTSNDKKLTKLI